LKTQEGQIEKIPLQKNAEVVENTNAFHPVGVDQRRAGIKVPRGVRCPHLILLMMRHDAKCRGCRISCSRCNCWCRSIFGRWGCKSRVEGSHSALRSGVETAPEKSRPLLEKIQKSFKFIPNLFGVFANSPVLLEGYLGLEGAFDKGSLSAVERSIVLLTASVENSCKYCTAAHSSVLKAFLHVPSEVVSAVRSNLPLPDQKLNSLVVLTREIVSERGHVGAQTIENFLAAGYRKDQIRPSAP
jgi:AhpD family alkylhydroperoxidase